MGILPRSKAYDRDRLLEQAAHARTRGRRRRAIALYRHVLAVERHQTEIHARLAPLLAETGQEFDAWNHYRSVAQAALREGREDRAQAIYQEASKLLPREIQVWQALARGLLRRGEEAAAVETLLEGSRGFRTPFLRPQAIHLLRRARTIDPWHFETVIELAELLARSEQRDEARLLLEGLAERARGRRLRRVRRARFALDPSPGRLWGWLRTTIHDPEECPPVAPPPERLEDDASPDVVPLRAIRNR